MRRKGRKRRSPPAVLIVCAVLTAGTFLGGCSREMTKTISLPGAENEEATIPGVSIKNIREYAFDGNSEDNIKTAWKDADTVCLFRLGEKGYTYRQIDVNTKETVSKEFVDDRMAFNIQIAPGGRYISYEAETAEGASPELVLFLAGEGKRIVLREWDECLQSFSYVWSDDGTKLFSWQNGDNYAFLPDNDWCVTCYDMEDIMEDSKGKLSVKKTVFWMEGSNYAWRSVLPSADGSKVYVREEFESFSDKGDEDLENRTVKEKQAQEKNKENEPAGNGQISADEKIPAKNWLLLPESHEKKKLAEYAKDPVYPVKYTKKGLYYQTIEGKLCLAEHVEEEPSVTELFSAANTEICICSKGDHIFFIDWSDDFSTLKLSGVRMEGISPTAKQVLYQAECDTADYFITADDSEIVLQGCLYLGNDRNSYKIMALGY